ncbi:putative (S)-scoulerine 9-O-methyltransferase [Rosa chinensis]|uniref:Putative (S)-scoulerine 9-O-methyltransferase n=1 Tax=Rosa chinensis TaxID=74649 RepID=A0A2P6QE06_ROSCH|nr:putative (S)-scoulerine 9-O-methyltransferase [Rosa chinensis]
MTLRAAVELNVFSGRGVHLTSEEIKNPSAAIANLERILKLLSVNSLLSASLRPSANDNTVQEVAYGLTKKALCLIPNEDGRLYVLKHMMLEPECSPFDKAHGQSLYEYMSEKPEMIQLFDKNVLEVYRGFNELKELMDVGGGDGSSIARIVSMHLHIHGINFNVPSVIA